MTLINKTNHWTIFLSNNTDRNSFVERLLKGRANETFSSFNNQKGVLFSLITLNEFIEEDERHEEWLLSKEYNRGIRNLSSGEQKKALLKYLLSQNPDFIILDNPFDNLDTSAQKNLKALIEEISATVSIILMISRNRDYLPFIKNSVSLKENKIELIQDIEVYLTTQKSTIATTTHLIPKPLTEYQLNSHELVSFKNVTVRYEERVIVRDINWTINQGEFWQLIGPNGSGKTTLLTMINGDNPKAYNQDLTLFGRRKGTGETVWEIKQKIGYLTPAMTELFSTLHTVEEMIVSGFLDSIGLYKYPTDIQLRLANEWLEIIELSHLKHKPFCKLSLGQQRLALVARAMVKHPPLLILDEAMSGLDDHNADIAISLINKIAEESKTAILYVSHRNEVGLAAKNIFELMPSENGSIGKIR